MEIGAARNLSDRKNMRHKLDDQNYNAKSRRHTNFAEVSEKLDSDMSSLNSERHRRYRSTDAAAAAAAELLSNKSDFSMLLAPKPQMI